MSYCAVQPDCCLFPSCGRGNRRKMAKSIQYQISFSRSLSLSLFFCLFFILSVYLSFSFLCSFFILSVYLSHCVCVCVCVCMCTVGLNQFSDLTFAEFKK